MELPSVLLSPGSIKFKKSTPKKYLVFPKIEISSSMIKKFLIFPERELSSLIFFSYFRRKRNKRSRNKNNPPQENFLSSEKMEVSNSNINFFFLIFLKGKVFLYFRKRKPRKSSLYLRKENFFTFQKTKTSKKIFMFQETLKNFLYNFSLLLEPETCFFLSNIMSDECEAYFRCKSSFVYDGVHFSCLSANLEDTVILERLLHHFICDILSNYQLHLKSLKKNLYTFSGFIMI